MQTFRHLDVTLEHRPDGWDRGLCATTAYRNGVMGSPFHHRSTAVTLISAGVWLSIAGQTILLVPEAAIHQAAGIPACAADRARPSYCHG